MGTFNLRKVLLVCGTLLSVLVLALGVVVTPTTAASSLESDCTNLYGTFSEIGRAHV